MTASGSVISAAAIMETLCGWPKYLPWVVYQRDSNLSCGMESTTQITLKSVAFFLLPSVEFLHILKNKFRLDARLNQIFFFVFRCYTPVRYMASKMLLPVQRCWLCCSPL